MSLLQVYAQEGEATETKTFNIPKRGQQRVEIRDDRPAKLVGQKCRFDTTTTVFDLITKFRDRAGVKFRGVKLNIGEGEYAVQVNFHDRDVTPDILEKVIRSLRDSLNEPDALIQLTIRDQSDFDTGFDHQSLC